MFIFFREEEEEEEGVVLMPKGAQSFNNSYATDRPVHQLFLQHRSTCLFYKIPFTTEWTVISIHSLKEQSRD